MISQDYNSIDAVNQLLRKIRIKESQLKIAQSSNMLYTSQVLKNQILELQHQLSDSQDPELDALMSLLED
ncbi:hypothetical protein PN483_06530 [Nodularia spumigena CS-591/04]|uniref:hypothetical protein n=1 Tax=Nodularia spumigena TaxID=70799 RepID=UPI002331205C|nr:hypothetical protein [Nodularia spumigena]MDB9320635.1 hypothetical protein [Nodularia spumigena CS-591/07A]MDB9330146.1 hypothetical protein [Nodularia spumigena CS-591/04]MDB9362869.1 hypothetical protein [Nodularia spumigena CS-588/02]MDB9363862.1 hypothetical protein [Nodularia spumigena CS-588/02A10]